MLKNFELPEGKNVYINIHGFANVQEATTYLNSLGLAPKEINTLECETVKPSLFDTVTTNNGRLQLTLFTNTRECGQNES